MVQMMLYFYILLLLCLLFFHGIQGIVCCLSLRAFIVTSQIISSVCSCLPFIPNKRTQLFNKNVLFDIHERLTYCKKTQQKWMIFLSSNFESLFMSETIIII
jgi:hypothetical protein